ncbi:hypothetical protein CSV79_14040 [Sporosarcina sp. P13]|uniref:ABC transporter substrate-binding protein n=1 Tax=Sporosarcina sp. P13 TaxID=2048263 RepID=UPI000C16E927|nr:ABC transporter substrate-binding protein [Sporosarcina sp. P13]PIC63017.1 hypothetical protein CSV79_14040 [Sporosarcina sp. P13]
MYRILISLLLVIIIAGCSNDNGDGGNENGESTLNIGYNAQPNSIDPHISNTATTTDVSRHIFEQLLAFNENNEVAPLLAESYDISEDGKNITFHLRKDIKFHNGKVMTADDVVASMERWRGLNGKAIAYLSNSEFVKEDENTVILRMDKPLTIVQYILAMSSNFGAIMPKEIIEAADTATGVKEYIGTGPFKFVEWKQDQHIKLSKNEDYKSPSGEASGLVGKREPLVDNIYFHIVKDASTRAAGIQTGEYDLSTQILTDNIEQLKNDPNLELHLQPASFLTSVFNKSKGLFADQRAREAVNLAVNKEEVMIAAYTSDEYYALEHGLMSESYPVWHNDGGKDKYNAYDPEAAKKLLKEAGYNGETIRIIATRDYEDHYQAAVVLQQKLEEIGMKVDLEVYDWPTLLEKRTDENAYDIYMMVFLTPTDPTQIQYLDSRYKFPGWTNDPEIDKLIDEMIVAPTPEEAKEIFTKIQEKNWEYLPAVKYGDIKRPQITSKEISGFKFFQGPVLWNVTKE